MHYWYHLTALVSTEFLWTRQCSLGFVYSSQKHTRSVWMHIQKSINNLSLWMSRNPKLWWTAHYRIQKVSARNYNTVNKILTYKQSDLVKNWAQERRNYCVTDNNYGTDINNSYFPLMMHSELINVLLYCAWSFSKYFRNTSSTTENHMKSKEMNRL